MKLFPAACWAASPAPPSKPSAWERKRCGPVPQKPSASWDGRPSPRMTLYAVQSSGSGPTAMPRLAIVAALEREVSELTKGWRRAERQHEGRRFIFFEQDEMVAVCGGIGVDAARRAAEAVIALYRPALVQSVGFAGALDPALHVADIFTPSDSIHRRDCSRVTPQHGNLPGKLATFL